MKRFFVILLAILLLSMIPLSSTLASSGGSWESREDMIEPRAGAAIAQVNGKIYIFGGVGDSIAGVTGEKLNTTYEYDPSTNVWTQKKSMTYSRGGVSAVVVNDKVYVMGGYYDLNGVLTRTDAVEVYDPSNDTWTSSKKMPTPKSWGSASVVDNVIYYFGGGTNDANNKTKYLNTVEAFDTTTNTWTSKAPMPQSLQGLSTIAYKGKIYAFGGYNNTTDPVKSVRVYDPANDSWKSLRSMPTGRATMGIEINQGKIYLLGGFKTLAGVTTSSNIVEIYNPDSDTWEVGTPLTSPRSQSVAKIVDGKLFIFGGTSGSAILNKVEMLDLNVELVLNATGETNRIILDWSEYPSASGYIIKRSVVPGGPYTTIETGVKGTTFVDNDVINGTHYYYVVTAVVNGWESSLSNEASAALQAGQGPDVPTGRVLLTIYISDGQIKEYDLSADELEAFLNWYDAKDAGSGPAKYAFTKTWNKGPFKTRIEYVIFDKILMFEVDEYDVIP